MRRGDIKRKIFKRSINTLPHLLPWSILLSQLHMLYHHPWEYCSGRNIWLSVWKQFCLNDVAPGEETNKLYLVSLQTKLTMKYCKDLTSLVFVPFKQDISKISLSLQFSLKILLQDTICFCTLPLQAPYWWPGSTESFMCLEIVF